MNEQIKTNISIGHIVAEDGRASVLLIIDDIRVNLTPEGAVLIAIQLNNWAEHAKDWKQKSDEERKADWLIFTDQLKLNKEDISVESIIRFNKEK